MRKLSLRKTGLYFLIACSCFVLSWAILKHYWYGSQRGLEVNYHMPRQVRSTFTVKNTTNQLVNQAELWIYGPVKQTSTQRCISLETSHPYDLISDDLGNQVLRFTFNDLAPYASKIITIKANLELSDTPNPIPLTDRRRYLRAEKYIEWDDPELQQLARELKTKQPVDTARNLFQWVADHIQYTGFSSEDRGALYALKERRGDCTEFAYLFTAFCRANNISARTVGGYVCDGNAVLKPNEYHNWAEFYDGKSWMVCDPQRRVFGDAPSRYIATKVIDRTSEEAIANFDRFQVKGEGLRARMNG